MVESAGNKKVQYIIGGPVIFLPATAGVVGHGAIRQPSFYPTCLLNDLRKVFRGLQFVVPYTLCR